MTQVKINGKEYCIRDIFCREFVFEIPMYQRPYAWTTEHAKDLLDDIWTALSESNSSIDEMNPYFLGSIVLIKEENKPKSVVVDGQQRLTTLVILLSAIWNNISPKYADDIKKYLYEGGDLIAQTPTNYRLSLRDRDNDFFLQYIFEKENIERLRDVDTSKLNDSQKNIAKNAILFLDFVKGLDEAKKLKLAQFIIQKCLFIVVTTPDLDSAYRIFSILNDRGLNLSHSDIFKADIIGNIAIKKQCDYAEKWESMEENLGREVFADLFGHIRMIYVKGKLKETLLKEFRQFVIDKEKSSETFIDNILLPFGDAYEIIIHEKFESKKGAELVNEKFRWLNQIEHKDWVPPALLYLSKNKTDPEKLNRFFSSLERLAVGLWILHDTYHSRLDRYGKVTRAIENNEDLFTISSPLQLTDSEKKKTLDALNEDFYNTKYMRYILLRLDFEMTTGGATYDHPLISVEHVLPQKIEPGSEWDKLFNKENHEKWVHKVGNLVLLTRKKNSSAGRLNFKSKKSTYFNETGITPFALTIPVLKESKWTLETIEKRQNQLIEKIATIWQLK